MENEQETRHSHHSRPSFFWPIALITAGIVWLMVNSGTIPVENVYRLLPFWPALLILAGISLLLERIWWPLSGLLWLGAAALVVWALLSPPAFLPQTTAPQARTDTFIEPLGDTQSAAVRLDLSSGTNRIFALDGSTDLINAEITHVGEIEFRVTGGAEKNIVLNEGPIFNFWNFDFLTAPGQARRSWEVGLTSQIPLSLNVDAGSGTTTLDLEGLMLESLILDGGSGALDINLPAGEDRYTFTYEGGSGRALITVPDGAQPAIELDGGSGSIQIDVPDDAGVQVDVRDRGSGALNLPRDFTQVSGDNDEGVWENEAYSSAENPITIIVEDQGSDVIEIR